MPQHQPVRFGLLGYGFGGRYFHAPLIAAAPGCELVGVVTRAAERRELLAPEHPDVAAYDSLADLAAAGIDAVAISTPADTHISLTQEALRFGLAVVCDKPFALEAASAAETVDLAVDVGRPLSVYQNRRWDSDLLTVRRLVDDGSLGTVTRFESRFERWSPEPGPPASGGGTLRDFGAHLVDQALQLFGPGRCVAAEMHVNSTGLDDDVFVLIQHDSGVSSHLSGSWVQGAPGPRFRVTGSTGTYVVGGMDGQEDALIAGRTPASEGERWGEEPPERWGRLFRGDGGEPVPSERGRWDTYYPAFAAAVRGEGQVPVDPGDAVAALRVLDEARSLSAARPLPLPPPAGR